MNALNDSQNTRLMLAKTMQAEAGSQGMGGMVAVGSVIRNRAASGNYGDGIEGVIMRPGQFSAWNSQTGYAGGEQGQDMANMMPSQEAFDAADAVLSGQYEDQTGGATHYYNPDISTPKWGMQAGGQWSPIGAHVFGNADAGSGPVRGNTGPVGNALAGQVDYGNVTAPRGNALEQPMRIGATQLDPQSFMRQRQPVQYAGFTQQTNPFLVG